MGTSRIVIFISLKKRCIRNWLVIHKCKNLKGHAQKLLAAGQPQISFWRVKHVPMSPAVTHPLTPPFFDPWASEVNLQWT